MDSKNFFFLLFNFRGILIFFLTGKVRSSKTTGGKKNKIKIQKVLAVHHAEGTEKGRLCTRKEPTGSGVYLQLVWAGLSDALLLWESLCSICRWQVKHKENPSPGNPHSHTTQPTSQAWQSSGGSVRERFGVSSGWTGGFGGGNSECSSQREK